MIEPIVSSLARRLKRTLQDSQNELLDNLRSHGSSWSADLLPAEVEQVDSLATAALPTLEEAAEAGVSFAGNGSGQPPRTDAAGRDRPRPGRVGGGSPAPAPGRRAERLWSGPRRRWWPSTSAPAFREWKGERIERLAGDHVVAAFSAGTLAALEGSRRPAGVGGRGRLGPTHLVPIARTTVSTDRSNPVRISHRTPASPGPSRVSMPLGPRPPRLQPCVPPLKTCLKDARPALAPSPVDHCRRHHRGHPHRLAAYVRRLLYRRPVVLVGEAPLRLGQAVRDQGGLMVTFAVIFAVLLVGQLDGGRAARPQGAVTRRRGRVRQALPGGDRSLLPVAAGGVVVVLSLIVGSQAIGQWNNWILFRNSTPSECH
jgi:hypothetical protein